MLIFLSQWLRFHRAKSMLLFAITIINLPQSFCQTYSNVSQQAGINHAYYHDSSLPINLMGGGVAVFDFNNDGWQDIYLTSGLSRDHLYKNNGNGSFTEIGIAAGLGLTQNIVTMGVSTGDIDNDGWRDIVITTGVGSSIILLRNNGDETFTNVSTSAGLIDSSWSMAASFGDYNLDGFLDIYVGNYVDSMVVTWDSLGAVTGFDHRCYTNLLFVNNGDFTFSEMASLVGVNDSGCALATAFSDFDGDSDMDLVVINDFGSWIVPNTLYENNGTTNDFTEIGTLAGMNAGIFGMGIAVGDYDEDLDLDYYVTNGGRNILYNNSGGGTFVDTTGFAGVENSYTDTLLTTGWGAAFFDFDNDSYLDLFVANGDVAMPAPFATAPLDPCKLYQNNGDGTFADVSKSEGVSDSSRNRGMAYADFDNDGDLDLVVTTLYDQNDSTAKTRLFWNGSSTINHWLNIKVKGVASNQDGLGAHVTVFANGRSFLQEIDGGSSYISQNSILLHFGLGSITIVDSVVVVFPGGNANSVANIGVDQTFLLVEDSIYTTLFDREITNDFSIYPNPAQDKVNFIFEGYKGEKGTIDIYNNLGQHLCSLPITHGPLTWSPEGLTGLFHCNLNFEFRSIWRKFIVQ